MPHPDNPTIKSFSREELARLVEGMEKGLNAKELPPESAERKLAEAITARFDEGMDYIRKDLPIPSINVVANVCYTLIHTNIVKVAVAGQIPSMAFTLSMKNREIIPMILVPPSFLTLDKHFIYGGLVYVSSQSRDFMNGKLLPETQDTSQRRARLYNAEYVKYVRATDPDYKLCEYEEHLLEQFGEGLNSPNGHALLYNGTWDEPLTKLAKGQL